MSDGISQLDQRIARFEELLEEMKEATREAHSALKQLIHQRKEIDRFLSEEGKKMVEDRVDQVVTRELDKIGPTVRAQTNLIYEKVSKQIDKLIDLSLGREFAIQNNREDLRPELAAKLREWILDVIERGE